MNEFKIVSLRNRSDLNLNASIYFSSKWNIPKESYLKEINSYINKESVRKLMKLISLLEKMIKEFIFRYVIQ